MRSKPILFSIVFSAIIVMLSMVYVPMPKMPFKTSFHSLNEDTQRQVTCLAENIYFEAGNEPDRGKKAVAFVTINRVKSGNYADDICGVVYQKTGGTCQFSWFCESKTVANRLTIKKSQLYNEIRELATNIVVNYEHMEDVTKGATYYHADYVSPGWKLQKIDQIGRHIFYKNHKDKIDRNKEFI